MIFLSGEHRFITQVLKNSIFEFVFKIFLYKVKQMFIIYMMKREEHLIDHQLIHLFYLIPGFNFNLLKLL